MEAGASNHESFRFIDVLIGLVIGSVVLFSNFQFGLQTGWVSMMSLPSAVLAIAISNLLHSSLSQQQNVFIQSLAVAVGTGPLAYGLVGVVPALETMLEPAEGGPVWLSVPQLVLWCFGLAFFGVFFAIPLRVQVILREKLPFPSGSATATLISVLHGNKAQYKNINTPDEEAIVIEPVYSSTGLLSPSPDDVATASHDSNGSLSTSSDDIKEKYNKSIFALMIAFSGSGTYSILAYFIPILSNLPVFGQSLADQLWTFQPSPAYFGQGMIMGIGSVTSMLIGTIVGWGILAPLARSRNWAPGPIDDWKTGAQGWIMWVALALMISDAIVSLSALGVEMILETHSRLTNEPDHPEQLSKPVLYWGLGLSSVLCAVAMKLLFPEAAPLYIVVFSLVITVFLAVLAVRALGTTDLNPVSGIGKLSQLIIAGLVLLFNHGSVPANAVVTNLIGGAISEAGAQQAGDLMQDLKTGYLLNASPVQQFHAQLLGSFWAALLAPLVYRLYMRVYTIPGPLFRIPTSIVWIDCARLVSGSDLPDHALTASIVAAFIGAGLALGKLYLERRHSKYAFLWPSGVAIGVGMYNVPSFTLARFAGGLFVVLYTAYKNRKDLYKEGENVGLVITASGLILGEGVLSIMVMILTSLNVPHL
ncbi:hypothetical protein CANCADRAFT_58164 [Tortispora caseinolytica NRRL Y-17796]|uniref:OPT superfamily oligopeptide transporter n=1 Tax=Tortispora caseinolytica NRRL Y-17796 TaxID=767744 RepID=A0A1E4TBS2_9ASCO|nr:hypothetical protein CANCADRAFT_58164 [Tortispora caseinolytica NRRL Y-17796]